MQIKSECKINVKYFPFDEQICKITLGSWTHHGGKLDISPKSETADLTSYVQNTEWKVIEAPFTKKVKYYGCCPDPYPSVTVHIRIRRRALFYLSNLVIPCGVIAILASLSFFLPSNNGERISLVVTVLLSLTVYMLIVSEAMPPTSEVVPLIGKFYISTMVLISLTLVAVCVTLNCCEKETRMSGWLHRILIGYVARFVCVSRSSPRTNTIGAPTTQAFVVTNRVHSNTKPRNESQEEKNASISVTNANTQLPAHLLKCNGNSKKKETASSEDDVSQSKHRRDEQAAIKAEWKTVSRVLDRVFFLLFLLSFLLMSTIVFTEAPHISLS